MTKYTEKDSSLVRIIEKTLLEHWDRPSMSDFGTDVNYTFGDVAQRIDMLHRLYAELGIEKGDKISLCDKNSSNWAVSMLSILTYGAVAVPILADFSVEQIENIYKHSDSKFMICGNRVAEEGQNIPKGEMLNIVDFKPFAGDSKEQLALVATVEKVCKACEADYVNGKLQPGKVSYFTENPDDLCLISYTSGSTGNSKGVMLPYRSLWSNVLFANDVLPLSSESKILSLLPLAHMYGFSFEFMFEFCMGCHLNFLTKAPSPAVLVGALAKVKPAIVIAVPLIIEKIVRGKVFPTLKTPKMRFLLAIPGLRHIIYNKIREKLLNVFGGQAYEIVAGGAAISKDVEDFLMKIKFPITVGYGMTECGPIICYEDYKKFAKSSCGKQVPRMEVRVLSPDPQNVAGEIVCRGTNVMLGYYKNQEATDEAIDSEGWLHTGDLGTIDKDGNVFIRGRKKSMLLGANGQNIYPEEVEDTIISNTIFDECVVVQRGEKLVCLAYVSDDTLRAKGLTRQSVTDNIDVTRREINSILPKFANLTAFELRDEEFVKTPKRNIKRYLYS